jgi:hypothetical protein
MTNPANTYSWKINHLIVKDQDSFARVVHSVNYTARAQQGDYFIEHTDEVAITTGDLSSSFTEFTQLTEELVMSWVMSTFSVDQVSTILSNLDQRLAQLINPPLRISGDLPWLPTTGAPDTPLVYLPPPAPVNYAETLGQPQVINTVTDFPNDLNIPVRG